MFCYQKRTNRPWISNINVSAIVVPQQGRIHGRGEGVDNKLQINITKTKELVFRRPSARHFSAPQQLPFIEQVTLTNILGIYISETLSADAHVMSSTFYQLLVRDCRPKLTCSVEESRVVTWRIACDIYSHCIVCCHLCSAIFCWTVVKRR